MRVKDFCVEFRRGYWVEYNVSARCLNNHWRLFPADDFMKGSWVPYKDRIYKEAKRWIRRKCSECNGYMRFYPLQLWLPHLRAAVIFGGLEAAQELALKEKRKSWPQS